MQAPKSLTQEDLFRYPTLTIALPVER